MTQDKYKAVLDAMNKWNCIDRRLNHKAREFGRDQAELFLECNLNTLRSALQLAQESKETHEKLADTRIENIKQLAIIQQLLETRDELAEGLLNVIRVSKKRMAIELAKKVTENA